MNISACPFCGEDAGEFAPSAVEHKGWNRVRCNRCAASSGEFRTVILAINSWNMRNGPKSITFSNNRAEK